jgi:apolipoprotein N-acyltransferase
VGHTFYSRFGDWLAYLALAVTVVSLAARARLRVD